MAKRLFLACAYGIASVRGISVGDTLPEANLDDGFLGLEEVRHYWQARPSGVKEKLKAAGVDEVVVFAVNDGAVMNAWAIRQGTSDTMVRLLGDTRMELTNALGVVLDHPGPMGVLGNNRCKRFSMFVNNCKIQAFNLAAYEDDPAGDDKPEVSMAEKMLEDIAGLKSRDEL